jgi:hypothetical protein
VFISTGRDGTNSAADGEEKQIRSVVRNPEEKEATWEDLGLDGRTL